MYTPFYIGFNLQYGPYAHTAYNHLHQHQRYRNYVSPVKEVAVRSFGKIII